jgi:Uma2 family endonuclease
VRTIEQIRAVVAEIIRPLSRSDREDLADWILNSEEFREQPSEILGDRVAEAVPAYGSASSHLSVDEYLKLEEESELRHEYIAGRIFAMSGAKLRHTVIVQNVIKHLDTALRASPCRAFGLDAKVSLKVSQEDVFYYPDIVVGCGPQDMDSPIVSEPRVIIEVLSPPTVRIDRVEKAINYRFLASLEEYVLIAQRTPEVTIHRRSERWAPVVVTALDATAEFRSIGASLPLDVIYADTR